MYEQQNTTVQMPDFDRCLDMLVKRKLIAKGIGYTSVDALYNMLEDTFLTPVRVIGMKKIPAVCKLLIERKIRFKDAARLLQPEDYTDEEQRVLGLIKQTPLRVAELIRCFDNGVYDVSTPDKVIDAIYTDDADDQVKVRNASSLSENRHRVLEAAANLYLARKITFERA